MQAQLESGPSVNLPVVSPKTPLQSPMRHLSKLKSTLHQFVRDWSEEVRSYPTRYYECLAVNGLIETTEPTYIQGKKEREMCYSPILKELKRVLPVKPENQYVCSP